MAERISTPKRTREIIEANSFAFKKNFGQNFLIDSNILDNIASCANVTKEDCVLEIGPGIGSLTQVLAENANQVVAVEIDTTLIPILQQWATCLEGALVYRSGVSTVTPMARELTAGRSAGELMQAVKLLQQSIEYAQGNVSVAAICGHLAWALR